MRPVVSSRNVACRVCRRRVATVGPAPSAGAVDVTVFDVCLEVGVRPRGGKPLPQRLCRAFDDPAAPLTDEVGVWRRITDTEFLLLTAEDVNQTGVRECTQHPVDGGQPDPRVSFAQHVVQPRSTDRASASREGLVDGDSRCRGGQARGA
jgi:hypothetical protein